MASDSSSDGPSFYLVPANRYAYSVLEHPSNAHLKLELEDGQIVLHLSFGYFQRTRITMGRSGCDVTIPSSHKTNIHRVQCIFTYNVDTGAVVLHDRSDNRTTKVYDPDAELAVPFSRALRSVIVAKGFNSKIAIGNDKYYQFQLVWHFEAIRSFSPYPYQFGPRQEEYDPDKFRYVKGDELGAGGFGTVWKAADIHNGDAMAVKRFHTLDGRGHVYAIREINNSLILSDNNQTRHVSLCAVWFGSGIPKTGFLPSLPSLTTISQDHILPIRDVVYDKKHYRWIEIFMPLKDGSLANLIKSDERLVAEADIADTVLLQMLKALRYTASKKIVHRDIKPENILFDVRTTQEGTPYYHFMLADFGLSNTAAAARSMAGTGPYMAPEVSSGGEQSHKMDIWSLFATIVWVHDANGFRDYRELDVRNVQLFLMDVAKQPLFGNISDMAAYDPKYRVSAKDLLSRLDRLAKAPPPINSVTSEFEQLGIGGGSSTQSWDGTGNFIDFIPEDVANQFAVNNRNSTHRMLHGTMNGDSALADFDGSSTYAAQPTTPRQPRTHGRVGRDYMPYADREPRQVVEETGPAEQAIGLGEAEEEEEEENKAAQKRNEYPVYYGY